MAWIEKTPNGYRVGWREGGRESAKQYRGAPDKRTASQLRQRIEQDLALHGRVTIDERPPTPPPLHTRLESWLDSLQIQVRPRTVTSYGDSCVLLLRYLQTTRKQGVDEIPLNALNRDSLVGFQAWLVEEGRTLTTVVKRAQAIRLAWEWLWEADGEDRAWLSTPPRRIQTRKSPPPSPIAPTWAEMDACVNACEHNNRHAPWLRPFALVLRFTGLRRSEVLLLEWKDIDLASNTMRLRADTTKGGYSGRRLPISPLLGEMLRGWQAGRQGEWVVDAPEKERLAATSDGRGHVDRNIKRAWVRAGVREDAWRGQPCHAFRKGFQTNLEIPGVRREVTEYPVGHQPVGTGARHYLDAERALWSELCSAVVSIPVVCPPGEGI